MPFLWLSLAFLVGIILADNLFLATPTWLSMSGAFFGLILLRAFILRRIPQNPILQRLTFHLPLPISVLLLTLCLGAARYQSQLPDLSDVAFVANHNDSGIQMMVTGIIINLPVQGDTSTSLRIETERMHTAGQLDYMDIYGKLLVSTPAGHTFHYGDRVVVRGYLETPPETETFSYRDYLQRKGIYSTMNWATVSTLEPDQGNWFRKIIFALKEKSLQLVYQLWPDPEASLFAGILLGVESTIPEEVQDAFKETGTSHIIAISGFNIAIVSSLFTKSFGRILGLYKGATTALVAISIYTILVGADAAVVRAAIMGGLSLGAGLVGRRQYGIHALSITAAVMAFLDPNILWDVGFQLSFAATLGLVLYAEPLQEIFTRVASRWLGEDRALSLAGPVGEFILFTFAAQVTTIPIMAYHFGTLSWVSFLVNPLILPFQPPIMVFGGLSLIIGLIWFPLGKILGIVAWPFVLYTIRAVEFFGRYTEGALILGNFSLLWLILYFAILLSVTFNWQRIQSWAAEKFRTEHQNRALFTPVTAILSILAVVVWRAALSAPDGKLHLTLLDAGEGTAVFIETPNGRNILVNGGSSPSKLSDALGRRLDPFQRELDWLVVASTQEEQISGLPAVVERIPPYKVLWAGLASPSREADLLREKLTDLQIAIIDAQPGQTLQLGDELFLKVLTCGPRGAILLLEWANFRAVLPFGVNDGDYESLRMGVNLGNISMALLADSGYAPTNPYEWFSNLNPQLALLSVAPDNRDGLPDQETLDALAGINLLRTDQNGWIDITTNGQQMWVETEK
jgi:competence protein ComEC